MTRTAKAALVLVAALAIGVCAVAAQIPQPAGFVTDEAGVIPSQTEARISALAKKLETNTGAQIAVLTVNDTGDEDIFDYSLAVAEKWKPGQKGKDNGVVLVAAIKDRKLQIQVGYGLEGVLPDGKVGAIEDQYIIPHFKQGDYGAGILQGVQALASVIDPANAGTYNSAAGSYLPPLSRTVSRRTRQPDLLDFLTFGIGLIIFIYLAIRHPRLLLLLLIFGGRGGGAGRGGGGFGGGFGGFGGGGFGGGGAGRSW